MECKFEQVALVQNCASAYLQSPCGMCLVSLGKVVKTNKMKRYKENTLAKCCREELWFPTSMCLQINESLEVSSEAECRRHCSRSLAPPHAVVCVLPGSPAAGRDGEGSVHSTVLGNAVPARHCQGALAERPREKQRHR